MSMHDPISDMLTRIRNAQVSEKVNVEIPFSNVKKSIADVLLEEGYIAAIDVVGDKASNKKLVLTLKYYQGKAVIERIERVSKPSLRVYRDKNSLPQVLGGLGIAIVSTSQGMMTDHKARTLSLGGEVICVVA
ncbi:30S ribosomal protein S8 [Ignatzschineria cameli]|uniref:Small ribosomal subunit protein uS8 n=1 Tax=Ignatzschineria cameli TaxID=2182793 RepID=A0A2U2ARS8_9GAMM|nr:30S ribosomal protein S8 [Ignatzschineria cameli]PWD86676.1 30S ribosomal protein S8 [Ignatzschineria cameli]PWD86971.1 30S ribosomal protein S8 [Ignatzschineria cameli]PWD91943.1 30S ribosomal protein S8 [Ignatzschineria cameli]PWD93470.1 30S ribosomal protein S8 [Ignatzschineria cameli]PWD94212.1 30S ribosomal protein S8 [Ignatzschineria cameli]